jgi:2'-5' RNA ligase
MQKYVLVTFLRPLADGTEFMVGHWPLHTTLVANFAVDLHATELPQKLAQLFANHKPLQTVAIHDDHFGPEGQVHVTRLQLTAELASLHNQAVELIRGNGAVFDEPEYLQNGYKPHVTVQSNGRVRENDVIHIDEVSLVDMFPRGDIRGRKVMRTFKLDL